MNKEHLPELQIEVVPEQLSPRKLPGWTEYSEAVLGDNGKKIDIDGNVVPYPHHLITP